MRLFALIALVLAGCASLSPATRTAFESFDPFTADFAALEALVEVPGAADLAGARAVLTLGAVRSDGKEVVAEVPLERVRAAAPQGEGRQAWWFRVPAAGAAELAEVQAEMRRWRDARQKASGRLGLAFSGCPVDAGAQPAEADVWLRLEADGALLPVQSGPLPGGLCPG